MKISKSKTIKLTVQEAEKLMTDRLFQTCNNEGEYYTDINIEKTDEGYTVILREKDCEEEL